MKTDVSLLLNKKQNLGTIVEEPSRKKIPVEGEMMALLSLRSDWGQTGVREITVRLGGTENASPSQKSGPAHWQRRIHGSGLRQLTPPHAHAVTPPTEM